MPYGVPEALHDVVTAKDGYVVATGTLTFNERKLPKVDMARQHDTKPVTRINARLNGHVLTKSGFTQRFNTRLSFEVHCYASWCANASSGKNVLAFLKQTETGYVLSTNPCGGHVFYAPSKADIKSVKQCYIDGICPLPNHR